MNSESILIKTPPIALKSALVAIGGVITTFFTVIPAHAHHPFEGRVSESFNLIEGLISGLAHPIIGPDHFLFLLSIGLVGALSSRRWIPILLISGFSGTLCSLFVPILFPHVEVIVGLSLVCSVLTARGLINPAVMLPLIACHGYVLGQPMIGAEPTPLIAYLAGLSISQGTAIICGFMFLRRCIKYKNILLGVFFGAGIVFTCGAIISLA